MGPAGRWAITGVLAPGSPPTGTNTVSCLVADACGLPRLCSVATCRCCCCAGECCWPPATECVGVCGVLCCGHDGISLACIHGGHWQCGCSHGWCAQHAQPYKHLSCKLRVHAHPPLSCVGGGGGEGWGGALGRGITVLSGILPATGQHAPLYNRNQRPPKCSSLSTKHSIVLSSESPAKQLDTKPLCVCTGAGSTYPNNAAILCSSRCCSAPGPMARTPVPTTARTTDRRVS